MTSASAAPEGNLPSYPDRALEVFLSILLDLKHIHVQELDTLRNHDTKGFMDLQPRKILLARDYEIGAKEIMVRTESMKKADKALRDLVVKEQMELETLAHETERAINIMTLAVKRVNQRLIDAARHAMKQDKPNYDYKGTLNTPLKNTNATAFNEAV